MSTKKGKIQSFSVQKGGNGKSTLSHAAAYSHAKKGKSVVLVDTDPQATLTSAFFGYDYEAFTNNDVSNITNIFSNKELEPIKIRTKKFVNNPNKGKMHQPHYLQEELELDFIPCNYELLDVIEGDEFKKEEKIKIFSDFLIDLKEKYDVVVVDCPPSFGILTTSILIASDITIVPIATKSVDLSGMVGFIRKLDKVFSEYKNINLKRIEFVPNFYDSRNKDCKDSLVEIKAVPNLFQQTKNLRKFDCRVAEKFPVKSFIQEAPSYRDFLEPIIMSFYRSYKDLILQVDKLVYIDDL